MRTPTALLLAVLTAGGLGLSAQTPAAGTAAAPAASDLAARIQAHYAQVRDFTADFTLNQTTALLPRTLVEHGTVKVKKPGRMRWEYQSGDKQQVIADGVKIYSYFPRDRYVVVTPMPKGDEASTALLFLTGRGDLTRDFNASMPAAQPPGEWQIALTPKTRQVDFTTLRLDVDRASLHLRGLMVDDGQGGTSTFRFPNLRENQNLTDKLFEFRPPPGVEIR